MKPVLSLSSIAIVCATTGCVATQAPPPDSMDVMSFACIRAAEIETNNHDVVVLGSDPSSGTWELTLQVGGRGIWSCDVSQTGEVWRMEFLGSDGSSLV